MADDLQGTIGTNAAGSEPVAQSARTQTDVPLGTKTDPDEVAGVSEARIIDEVVIQPPPIPPLPPSQKIEPPKTPPPPTPAVITAPIPTPGNTAISPILPPASLAPPVTNEILKGQDQKNKLENPLTAPKEDALSAAPLVAAKIGRAEEGREKNAIEKILNEVKIPERVTLPDQPEVLKEANVYDTSLASPLSPTQGEVTANVSRAPMTAQAGERSGTETHQTTSESSSSIVVPVRTLKNDFQDIVREKKISLVSAAALEQDKKRDLDKTYDLGTSSRKRHTFGIVFASILLALLGTAAFFGVAIIMQDRSGITGVQSDASLLFAEVTFPLPLENLSAFDVKRLLAEARLGTNSTLGSITRIAPIVKTGASADDIPEERLATLEEFLRAIGAHVSPELIRALGSEFFFGIHTVDENAPLLIIPVSSYERAFAGMLEWESALNADLAPVFTPIPNTILSTSGLLEKRRFEDLIMRNYDVRVLKDNAGTIQLYYSFPTRELLIIAESPYSFAEILARLRAERKL